MTGALLLKTNSRFIQPTETPTLITETVTSSSAASVSFTSIPATWRDLEVRVRGRGTNAGVLIDFRYRFNNDSSANYDYILLQPHIGIGVFSGLAQTSGYMGVLAAAGATANYADFAKMLIADYRGTTFQKASVNISGCRTSSSTSTLYTELTTNWWRSTAAINRVDIFPSSNAFVDGSVVSLYGTL